MLRFCFFFTAILLPLLFAQVGPRGRRFSKVRVFRGLRRDGDVLKPFHSGPGFRKFAFSFPENAGVAQTEQSNRFTQGSSPCERGLGDGFGGRVWGGGGEDATRLRTCLPPGTGRTPAPSSPAPSGPSPSRGRWPGWETRPAFAPPASLSGSYRCPQSQSTCGVSGGVNLTTIGHRFHS